jgi:hypothetical protein
VVSKVEHENVVDAFPIVIPAKAGIHFADRAGG